MAETQTITTQLIYASNIIGDAVITITPSGQEDPDVSDEVYVVGELELPCKRDAVEGTVNKTLLHPDLCFGTRVATVFGKALEYDWSSADSKCARQAVYTGTDYVALMATAVAYATAELHKLVLALAAREAALEAAG